MLSKLIDFMKMTSFTVKCFTFFCGSIYTQISLSLNSNQPRPLSNKYVWVYPKKDKTIVVNLLCDGFILINATHKLPLITRFESVWTRNICNWGKSICWTTIFTYKELSWWCRRVKRHERNKTRNNAFMHFDADTYFHGEIEIAFANWTKFNLN